MTGKRNLFVGLLLMGGLGNQMFQYACGYAVAARMNAALYIDTEAFARDPLREYALGIFCLPGKTWPGTSPLKTRWGKLLFVAGSLCPWLPGLPFIPVREAGFAFNPAVMDVRNSCYLRGYWQSWKYFLDQERAIRSFFSLDRFLTGALRGEYAGITAGLSVSLHIRRGDYAASPVHGLCELEYYERAAAVMRSCLPGCRFHVFSDEMETARTMLAHWDDAVFMPQRSQEEDMLLMSACRHHIIANSSFSWWAAWLGEHPKTLTIAPERWFADAAMQAQTKDLLPKHWMRL